VVVYLLPYRAMHATHTPYSPEYHTLSTRSTVNAEFGARYMYDVCENVDQDKKVFGAKNAWQSCPTVFSLPS
jgi:hypothetical protein